MLKLFLACVRCTFSSHRQSSTGGVVIATTCATSPLSQITSKTKRVDRSFAQRKRQEKISVSLEL